MKKSKLFGLLLLFSFIFYVVLMSILFWVLILGHELSLFFGFLAICIDIIFSLPFLLLWAGVTSIVGIKSKIGVLTGVIIAAASTIAFYFLMFSSNIREGEVPNLIAPSEGLWTNLLFPALVGSLFVVRSGKLLDFIRKLSEPKPNESQTKTNTFQKLLDPDWNSADN